MMKKGELLGKVIVLATNAHAGQFDLGGNPYILHPLKVMHYLKTNDEELQCMAILHDVIEDTDVTLDDLRDIGCTERVIAGVDALTKREDRSYDDYKEQVFKNRDAMLVKMADLRHNSDIRRLKGASQKDIERMSRYNRFYLELQARITF
jgi:(p)ppGpp synthase/HD superfamily hydrolase